MSIFTTEDTNGAPGSTHGSSILLDVDTLREVLPMTAQSRQLIDLLLEPRLDDIRLAQIVEQTPSLAARLMALASLPGLALSRPMRGPRDAVRRVLGFHEARDLSIALVLKSHFVVTASRYFNSQLFWAHAALTAYLAKHLALEVSLIDPQQLRGAHLGGLVHGLGMPASVHLAPQTMDKTFRRHYANDSIPLSARQRRIFGIDYATVGGLLADAWVLPPSLSAVMRHHRDRNYRGAHRSLVSLVRVAERLASLHLRGDDDVTCFEYLSSDLVALGLTTSTCERQLAGCQGQSDRIQRLARIFALGDR